MHFILGSKQIRYFLNGHFLLIIAMIISQHDTKQTPVGSNVAGLNDRAMAFTRLGLLCEGFPPVDWKGIPL